MGINRYKITRQELINLVREVAVEFGGNLSCREFEEKVGIPRTVIYRIFGTWVALKKAAGLPDKRPYRNYISDEQLLRGLHAIVTQLGRFPRGCELGRGREVSYDVLYNRWGTLQRVAQHYRRWVKVREEAGQEALNVGEREQCNFTEDMPDAKTADFRWLRRTWQSMKVAFELHSSDFNGRPAHLCDLLVVLEHDWPACPVKVLQLADILPQHRDAQPQESDRSFSPY